MLPKYQHKKISGVVFGILPIQVLSRSYCIVDTLREGGFFDMFINFHFSEHPWKIPSQVRSANQMAFHEYLALFLSKNFAIRIIDVSRSRIAITIKI